MNINTKSITKVPDDNRDGKHLGEWEIVYNVLHVHIVDTHLNCHWPLPPPPSSCHVMPWDIICRAQLLMETANDSSLGPDAFLSIVKQESANKIECARLSRSYRRQPRAHQ